MDNVADQLVRAIEFQKNGELERSAAIYQSILASSPNHESALVNLGIVYFQRNEFEKAFIYLEKAVKLHPGSANAVYNLGYALMKSGEREQAINHFGKSISLQPRHFNAYLNLANCLHAKGKLQEANMQFTTAYQLRKDSLELLNNWAYCNISLKQFDQAEKIIKQGIRQFPGSWELYANLGVLSKEKWNLKKAEEAFKKAVDLGGSNWQVYHSLAAVYHNWNKKDSALSYLERARELNPKEAKLHSDYLYHLNYYPQVKNQFLFEQHKNWAALHAPLSNILTPKSVEKKPLKVGLLSGDFCYHPVAIFLLGWLDKVVAQKVTFHAYAEVRNRDGYTKRVRQACSSWTETNSLTDQQVAQKIHADEIDILIDLAGHTKGNRLKVLSYKPAPVLASYLGYINTTGLSQVDYRIVDRYVNPPETQSFYTEKLIYLPRSYTCYEPVDQKVSVAALPAISNGFITFGCFNNPTKINLEVARLWKEILDATFGSRLFLKARHFSEKEGRTPIIELMKQAGVEESQLIFEGPSDLKGYLEAYDKVDIALDTFPHNGGTTTHDALFMGVPVVGLVGDNYVSRMGVSIMNNLGHSEWVADSKGQLLKKISQMTSDFGSLSDIRAGLRAQFLNSPLCDGAGFAREMELLFSKMMGSVKS